MQFDSYEALVKALEGTGLTGQEQIEHQLIVSCQQGAVWPNRGNSFWVSRRSGCWYLATWSPIAYKVPSDQDLLKLCQACIAVGNSAMYDVPPEIIERFLLQRVDDEE